MHGDDRPSPNPIPIAPGWRYPSLMNRDVLGAENRRRFLKKTLIAAMGSPIPFIEWAPSGWTPLALAQEDNLDPLPGKNGLRILGDRPVNAETPVTLLDDAITPNDRHFVRNNGIMPDRARNRTLDGWSLQIDGQVQREGTFDLATLQSRYRNHEAALVLECGGNGRAGFNPPASGNQWTLGAVGCALYRGIRLADVLEDLGVHPSAVYAAYYGEDLHLSRDPNKDPISRGVPIEKAMDPHTLLVWEMNGEPLPAYHGFPLRLMCPGWPGSTCGKWLRRLWVRDVVHDGAKMTGTSYRVPKYPVAPGTDVPEADFEIIEEMPVKSIITDPGSGSVCPIDKPLNLRGAAWSGSGRVQSMSLSADFGRTWVRAELDPPRNRYAWSRWNGQLRFPKPGYYEVWARATDPSGASQPMVVGPWNPKGYLNNAMQRIAVQVIA